MIIDVVLVAILALLATAAFSFGRLGGSQWPGAIWFFLLLFFGTWAMGIWLRPMEPPGWAFRLVPYVIAAGLISVALAWATSSMRSASDTPNAEGARRVALGVTAWALFWAAVSVSVAAIVIRYVTAPR